MSSAAHTRGPIRVAHVLGGLGRGGAETWLVQVLESFDRDRFATDILVIDGARRAYRDAMRGLGCGVLECGPVGNLFTYSKRLTTLLQEYGPYDVVHSHLQFFSGLVLRSAARAGVPVRIAHVRNSSDGKSNSPARAAYRLLMRRWLTRHTSHRLAVSRAAALRVFGAHYGDEGHCDVVSGIDFRPFRARVEPTAVRASLGIPPGSRVIGHVGSFRRQKNHEFLLKVAQRLADVAPEAFFLLIGDGPLKDSIESTVREAGLVDRFLILGDREDVPRIMLGAMDSLLFPSLYEGLPRVLLEAQAAGLPCVASDSITREAEAIPGTVRFVSLKAGAEAWARVAACSLAEGQNRGKGSAAIEAFSSRGLTVEMNAHYLSRLYGKGMSAS